MAASRIAKIGLAKLQKINLVSEQLALKTHFTIDESKSLLNMHEAMSSLGLGKIDRLRFRDFLHFCFDITDDIMLDLTYRSFDRNSDGNVDEIEFVTGLSVVLRGNQEELIEFCYFVYDMNGDRSLAREELYYCLKGCMISGYGVNQEDLAEGEKEMVEIAMRKLDVNRDGQITYDDYQDAVKIDPLLLTACGPCLPTAASMAAFLGTITEDYRAYAALLPRMPNFTAARKKVKPGPSLATTGSMIVNVLRVGSNLIPDKPNKIKVVEATESTVKWDEMLANAQRGD